MGGADDDEDEDDDGLTPPPVIGSAYGSLVMLLFTNSFLTMAPAILGMAVERPVFVRERSTHTYYGLAYFAAKLVSEVVVTIVLAVVLLVITWWAVQWNGSFGVVLADLFMTMLVNVSIGQFLAAALPQAVAMGVFPLVLVWVLLGGTPERRRRRLTTLAQAAAVLAGHLRAHLAAAGLGWCVSFVCAAPRD